MKISYAIPVCNEEAEIEKLLNFLEAKISKEDEVIVLFDTHNGSQSVEQFLRAKSVNPTFFNWYPYHFDGHFANMKNLKRFDKMCFMDAAEELGMFDPNLVENAN